MTRTADTTGSWRELLGAEYLGTSVVLAGGVALYATNEFLTSSLLPNTVAEIGGSRLYAWVTTLYLVGSVVAATLVNPILLRVGARASYLAGLAVFAVSSLVCGAAPTCKPAFASHEQRATLRRDDFVGAIVTIKQNRTSAASEPRARLRAKRFGEVSP